MSPVANFRVPMAIRLEQRRAIDPLTGCWEWGGSRDSKGYGRITIEGKTDYVHRISWQEASGSPIPKDRVVDHICENRACFNPSHLELVTTQENTNRRRNSQASRTHCPEGHRYAGENLRVHVDKQGQSRRYCVICNKVRSRAWRNAHIGAVVD